MAVLGSLEAFSQRCFFCAVFFQKGRREVEKNALVWLGSIYYRSVHLSTVDVYKRQILSGQMLIYIKISSQEGCFAKEAKENEEVIPGNGYGFHLW